MWSKKDWIIFFAGVEVFHALSHIVIALDHTLPLRFFFIEWTQQLNLWAIVINSVIAIALLWWASQLSCCEGIKRR